MTIILMSSQFYSHNNTHEPSRSELRALLNSTRRELESNWSLESLMSGVPLDEYDRRMFRAVHARNIELRALRDALKQQLENLP